MTNIISLLLVFLTYKSKMDYILKSNLNIQKVFLITGRFKDLFIIQFLCLF